MTDTLRGHLHLVPQLVGTISNGGGAKGGACENTTPEDATPVADALCIFRKSFWAAKTKKWRRKIFTRAGSREPSTMSNIVILMVM